MSERVPLVDVHAHFVTAAYVEAARAAGHISRDGMPRWPSWNPAAHLELMDSSGIKTSVLSVSSPGIHFGDDPAARALSREVNEFAARLVREHPGRFGSCASLPLPDVDDSLAELSYAIDELSSWGVAVDSNVHGRHLGDPDFEPVWPSSTAVPPLSSATRPRRRAGRTCPRGGRGPAGVHLRLRRLRQRLLLDAARGCAAPGR